MTTMDEFGYAQCKTCHGEHLAFSLLDGECYWCREVLRHDPRECYDCNRAG
jgi:hypothetical protein